MTKLARLCGISSSSSSGSISGWLAVDNSLEDVKINGQSSGVSLKAANGAVYSNFASWHYFTLVGLRPGNNTVSFVVKDYDGVTGLAVAWDMTPAAPLDPANLPRFLWQGQMYDQPTGLYVAGNGEDYVDPITDRFLSQDKANSSFNNYVFVKNNPWTYSDPTGLSAAITQFSAQPSNLNLWDGLPLGFTSGNVQTDVGPQLGLSSMDNSAFVNSILNPPMPSQEISLSGLNIDNLASNADVNTGQISFAGTGNQVPHVASPVEATVGGASWSNIGYALAWDALDYLTNVGIGMVQANGGGGNIRASSSFPGSVGRVTGYAIATAQGIGEDILGAGGEVLGATLDATGIGALIGVPTGVISTAAIVHGSAVGVNAIRLAAGTNIGNGSAVGNLPIDQPIVLNQTGQPNAQLPSQSNPYLRNLTPLPGTRDTGVKRAVQLEVELVRTTGQGTVDWTPEEIEQIKQTGKLPEGTVGHHINSVVPYDDWAGDPRNIKFVRGQGANLEQHGGNFQNATQGPLIDRQALIDAANH